MLVGISEAIRLLFKLFFSFKDSAYPNPINRFNYSVPFYLIDSFYSTPLPHSTPSPRILPPMRSALYTCPSGVKEGLDKNIIFNQ